MWRYQSDSSSQLFAECRPHVWYMYVIAVSITFVSFGIEGNKALEFGRSSSMQLVAI